MKLPLFQKSAFGMREKILSLLLALFFAFCLALGSPLASFNHALQNYFTESRLDQRYFDKALKKFNYSGSAPIILVKIDDESLKALNLEWPIPRSTYADLLDKIEEYHPRVIGLDLTFPDKSPKPENDRKLAQCLRKYDNVILGSVREQDKATGTTVFQYPTSSLIGGWSEKEKQKKIGFVDSGVQERSGIIRKAYLLFPENGRLFYSFDALILSRFLELPLSALTDHSSEGYQQIGDIKVPVDDRAMWINYVSMEKGFSSNIYQACSLIYVLKEGDKYAFDALFRNNIVLVGVSATSGYDIQKSPFGNMTGTEIHVNVLMTTLLQKSLKNPGPLGKFLMILLPSMVMVFLLPVLTPAGGFVLFCLLNMAIFLFSRHDFLQKGILHYTFESLALLMTTYAVMSIAYFAKLHRHRKHLKNLLLELAPVPEPVLEKIIAQDQGQVRLGGEKVELTVLFSDIRGYTNLSQNLDPREVMNTLNEYYSATGSIYKKNGGMVFDTMGDGQMLVFGAEETSRSNHAFRACKAALELLEVLNELNARWQSQNRQPVAIGIGINTGPVSLGFLGTRGHGQHKQYAAIGDTTNVASRIEGLTKQLQAAIIISESTFVQARDLIETEPLPPTKVKGKDEPLNIYKVTGLKVKDKQG